MKLEFRGLYQSHYIRFLEELGGTAQLAQLQDSDHNSPNMIVIGDGWTAEFEPESYLSFSKTVIIPRTFITFSGEPDTVEQVVAQFRLKALRGGG